jgi:hypothetical protein
VSAAGGQIKEGGNDWIADWKGKVHSVKDSVKKRKERRRLKFTFQFGMAS